MLPTRNGTLSNDSMTITKNSGGRTGWDCNTLGSVGWTTGVHEFDVVLDTKAEIMIGVAPPLTNPIGPNWSSTGFYLGTQSGCLFGQDGTWKRPCLGGKCSRKGSVISVRLDVDQHMLWFGIDGKFESEPAWTSLPDGVPLHPSIDLDSKGQQITIIRK